MCTLRDKRRHDESRTGADVKDSRACISSLTPGVVLESSGDLGSGDSLFSDEDKDSFGGNAKAGLDDDDDDEDEDDEDDATDEYLS